MPGALLYQPRQSWRVGVAFGAAALIHFAAVALASIHRHDIDEVPSLPPGIPELEFESATPTDDPTLPPDVLDPRPLLNPADDLFVESMPSPPPDSSPSQQICRAQSKGEEQISRVVHSVFG